jgi:hypothetical protein
LKEIRRWDTGELLRRVDGDSLEGVDLQSASLARADLRHQTLAGANLRSADLSGAFMYLTDLEGANLCEANLKNARLLESDLMRANLSMADLQGADLTGTVLVGAEVRRANLCGARLACANLAGACLRGTDLTGACLEDTILDGVGYDAHSRWPDGIEPPPPSLAEYDSAKPLPSRSHSITYPTGEADPESVIVWSLQPRAVWNRLREEKLLYANSEYAEPDWATPYEWMRRQMTRRVAGYQGHNPWWAWFLPKPDLRRRAFQYGFTGSQQVRLTLAMPREEILLSEYQCWYRVYNQFDVHLNHEDWAWYHAMTAYLDENGIPRTQWPLPEPWQTQMESSWELMFDLERIAGTYLWHGTVQATFERLELSRVVAVTEFIAR